MPAIYIFIKTLLLTDKFTCMKKLLILFLFATTAITHAFAQKVTVEDDKILVDGVAVGGIEKDGCGFNVQCQYHVKSLAGKRLFVVKHLQFSDPNERSAANPEGKVHYLQYVFTKAGTKAETAFPTTLSLRAKDVARLVVKAGLLKDGALNDEAAADFVTNNGTPYTDRRKEIAGPKVIIIEN